MKRSIAILHYSCYPVIGGVETLIEAHARLFAGNGYKVKVVVGNGSVFDKRVPVYTIQEMDALDKKNLMIREDLENKIITKKFWKRTKTIYKKLRKHIEDSDIIFIHNIMTMHFNLPLTTALRKIIKESSKKFVIWTHDVALNDPNYKEKIKNILLFNLLAKKIEKAKYICISELRKKQISKLLNLREDEVIVIPDGVSLKFFGINKLTFNIFKFFDLFNQDLVLLTPTRIVRRKNLELAVNIVKELNKFKKAKLIITGAPDPHNKDSVDYYNCITDLIEKLDLKDKAILLCKFRKNGRAVYISDEIMKDLFLLCDALLFPSKQEGFGIPMLEAGLANKPIFCSNIEALKEIGRKDVLYFNIDDKPENIAKNIICYYNRHITKNMFKRSIREYTWENIFRNKIEPLVSALQK